MDDTDDLGEADIDRSGEPMSNTLRHLTDERIAQITKAKENLEKQTNHFITSH